jgi:hypothetical protein
MIEHAAGIHEIWAWLNENGYAHLSEAMMIVADGLNAASCALANLPEKK